MKHSTKTTWWLSLVMVSAGAVFSAGCSLFFIETPSVPEVDYYSKTVDYSRYIDPYEYYLEPVETRIYDYEGVYDGLVRYSYKPMDADEYYWVLSRADIYSVSDGVETLVEYYKYSYLEDTYTWFDEDGEAQVATEYLLKRGEGYSADKILMHCYDILYDDFDYQIARYKSIRDYSVDATGSLTEIATQTSTYALVSGTAGTSSAYYDYVTEKYYDTPPDGALSLAQEFASWYNTDGYWTHELFHTVRSGGVEAIQFFYTKYDWNPQNLVYRQQDFLYTNTGLPAIQADGSFNATIGSFALAFGNIGSLVESLEQEYDEQENVVLKLRSTYGNESERIEYRYNGTDQVSEVRYVEGSQTARDSTETRYFDQYRDGVYYQVKESFVYRSFTSDDDDDNSKSLAARALGRGLRDGTRSLSDSLYLPVRSNHDR